MSQKFPEYVPVKTFTDLPSACHSNFIAKRSQTPGRSASARGMWTVQEIQPRQGPLPASISRKKSSCLPGEVTVQQVSKIIYILSYLLNLCSWSFTEETVLNYAFGTHGSFSLHSVCCSNSSLTVNICSRQMPKVLPHCLRIPTAFRLSWKG